MTRLASRIADLERVHEEERAQDRPPWWALPAEEWHLGAVGHAHEEALAELDAEQDAEREGSGAP
jgi:hypothetical protein